MEKIKIPNEIESNLTSMYEKIADENGYNNQTDGDKVTFGRKMFLVSQTPDAILLFMPNGITKDDVYKLIAKAYKYEKIITESIEYTEIVDVDSEKIDSPDTISFKDVIVNGKKMVEIKCLTDKEVDNPIDYNYFSRLKLAGLLKNWIADIKNNVVEQEISKYKDEVSNSVPDITSGARIF